MIIKNINKKLLLAMIAMAWMSIATLAQGGSGSQAAPVIRSASAATIAAPCVNGSNPVVNNGSVYVCKATVWTALASGSGTIGGSIASNQVAYGSGANAIQGASTLTYDGTTLVTNGLKDTALTSGRVPFATTGGLLTDDSKFTYTSATPAIVLRDLTISSSTGSNQIIAVASTSNGYLGLAGSGGAYIWSTATGKVGIGTSAPSGFFGVDAAAASGAQFTFVGNSGNAAGSLTLSVANGTLGSASFGADASGNAAFFSLTASKGMGFYNSVNTKLLFLDNGGAVNVGGGSLTGSFNVTALSSSTIGQIIKLAASQNADAFQVQNSSGTVLTWFDKDGLLTVGNAASSSTAVLVKGSTNGVRIGNAQIDGVDNTGSASYQPIKIGGSTWALHISNATILTGNSTQVVLSSAYPFTWGSSGITSPDLGLARNAAGILEINNGTAGTYRDLQTRNTLATTKVLVGSNSGYPSLAAIGANVALPDNANYGFYLAFTGSVQSSTNDVYSQYFTVSGKPASGASHYGLVMAPTVDTGNGNLSKAVGIDVQSIKTGANSITGAAGIMIESVSMATNNTGLLIGTTTIPSGSFSIYTTGDARIGGNSAFGGTAVNADVVANVNSNAADPASAKYGFVGQRNLTMTANNAQMIIGVFGQAGTTSGAFNATGLMAGGQFQIIHGVNSTMSQALGVQSTIYNTSASGTITSSWNFRSQIQVLNASGVITNAYNFYANHADGFNSGTITNLYGLYVANPPSSGTLTNNYGVYIENQTRGGTLNYAIYSAGGASLLNAGSLSATVLTLKGAVSQSANLLEFKNSSNTTQAFVDPSGQIVTIGTVGFASWVDATPTKAVRQIADASGNLLLGTYNGSSWLNPVKITNGAPTNSLVIASNGDTTFSNNIFVGPSTIESFTTTGSAFGATLNYYTDSQTIYRNTGTAANDVTVNVDASASVDLNTRLAVGQAITIVVTITNGGVTAYKVSALNIHSVAQTIKWPNGTAPTAGLSEEDWYTFTILKTGASTYYVTGVMTAFK